MDQPTPARPLGAPVDFTAPLVPGPDVIPGDWVRLERLSADRHAGPVFDAQSGHDALWDYMPNGPYPQRADFDDWVAQAAASTDPVFYAILPAGATQAQGYASLMRIDAKNGAIEIGNILLTPALQQRREASAALMQMIRWAFEAGYRRVEWKCNALNGPSRRAALRLGFSYEGTFRQHMIVKGLNRDTAWFAIIDSDWPALRQAWDDWLAPANFDADGQQRQSLTALTAQALPGRSDGGA